MKKIYICGDSFSSIDPRCPGEHWSERLQLLLGEEYTVTNLAVPGASHFLIYMQVRKAANDPANAFVIINGTSIARLDVRWSHDDKMLDHSAPLINQIARNTEFPQNHLHDTLILENRGDLFKSGNHGEFYTTNPGTVYSPFSFRPETERRQHALKWYYLDLQDNYLDTFKDAAFMDLSMRILREKDIKFCFNENLIDCHRRDIFNTTQNDEYCHLNLSSFSQINRAPPGDCMPVFHTEKEEDLMYIANYYYELIKRKNI